MNLIWNRVLDDNSINRFFKFQNRSLVPDSKVFVKIQAEEPTSEEGALVIVSKQVLNIVIKAGEVAWTASADGGVATHVSATMPKMENYNIASEHHEIQITDTPMTINVPEGATLTFQNLSLSNVGARIGSSSQGGFILTQYQIMGESFPKADTVTFLPDSNNTPSKITYAITQSAIITQLSETTRTELEAMKASILVLLENSVTEDSIDAVKAMIYHNNWSLPNFIQRSNTKLLFSYPFIGNIKTYHSRQIQNNYGFEAMYDLNVTFKNPDETLSNERGLLYIKGIYKNSGVGTLLVSRCSNVNLSKIIEHVVLNVSKDQNEIKLGVTLLVPVITSAMTTMVKIENNYMEPVEQEISDTEFITSYGVDLVNAGVDISSEADEMLVQIVNNVVAPRKTLKYTVATIAKTEESDEAGNITEVTSISFGTDSMQFRKSETLSEFVNVVNRETLEEEFRSMVILKVYNDTDYKFTANLSATAYKKAETITPTTRTITTDLDGLEYGELLDPKITSIAVGDIIEVGFRKEGLNAK